METETQEEEAKVLLDTGIYGEGKYADEDDTIQTDEGQIILCDDMVETREGCIYHSEHLPDDVTYCDDIDEYSSENTEVITGYGRTETWHNSCDATYYGGCYYSNRGLDANDIYQCDYCGDYYEGDSCDCGRGGDCHDDYHNERSDDVSGDSICKIGIEFEKCNPIDNVSLYKDRHWRCETDSSCGYEYITPVLNFDKVDTAYDWIVENGEEIIKQRVNSDCGGHIHISKKGVRPDDLYNNIAGWRPLLWGLYPHRLSGYSRRDGDKYKHSVDVGVRDYTVEIRIFPGCDNKNTLRFRMEIVKFMMDNPAKNTTEALKILGMKQLSFAKILDIVYGGNTERLMGLFDRIHKFYNEGVVKPNNKILQIQKRIMNDKARGAGQESDE